MTKLPALLASLALLLGSASCRGTYYGVMEKLGVEKRDILVDRVEEGREAQQEAKEEFQDALKAFQSVTGFRGGDLERLYDRLRGAHEDCGERVADVHARVEKIETVANDLFDEWRGEIRTMKDASLRRQSERTLDDTRDRYDELITKMKKAASKMDPVLVAFRDHVLFLKHNLNAQAIASLSGNLGELEADVAGLIREMEASIAEADAFVKQMKG